MRSRKWRKARTAREIVFSSSSRRVKALWPRRTGARSLSRNWICWGKWRAPTPPRSHLVRHRARAVGRGQPILAPEMRERVRRLVFRALDPKLRGDAFAQQSIHVRDVGLAVEFNETVSLGKIFEFPLDHGLVADEGLEQIV